MSCQASGENSEKDALLAVAAAKIDVESASESVDSGGLAAYGRSGSMRFLAEHKKVTFTLSTLPSFNYTKIIRCLNVQERLCMFSRIHPRFKEMVFQPHCFLDMSFFPIEDESIYEPKILSVTGTAGITYVEVNVKSSHPFVTKVAVVAGMWNFRAELWNRLHWPTKLCIESLQLTLDGLYGFDNIRLDEQPEVTALQQQLRWEQQQEKLRKIVERRKRAAERAASTTNDDDSTSESYSEGDDDDLYLDNEIVAFSDLTLQTDDGCYTPSFRMSPYASSVSLTRSDSDGSAAGILSRQSSLNASPHRPFATRLTPNNMSPTFGPVSPLAAHSPTLGSLSPLSTLSTPVNTTASAVAAAASNCQVVNTTHAAVAAARASSASPKPFGAPAANDEMELANLSMSSIDRMIQEYKLRNLFFIRFDTDSYGPTIWFPKTLHGLGLQGFATSVFRNQWWTQQVVHERRFQYLRFLVLAQCEFTENQLQSLLKCLPKLQHISLRYVKWEGTIEIPESVLSIGYFPDSNSSSDFSLKKCKQLYQIQTRLNENTGASIAFLNYCRIVPTIRYVQFEYIRQHQRWLPDVDLTQAEEWKDYSSDLRVVVNADDLAIHPILTKIFPLDIAQFVDREQFDFLHCPYWSPEAIEFITMTKHRKLLLR